MNQVHEELVLSKLLEPEVSFRSVKPLHRYVMLDLKLRATSCSLLVLVLPKSLAEGLPVIGLDIYSNSLRNVHVDVQIKQTDILTLN